MAVVRCLFRYGSYIIKKKNEIIRLSNYIVPQCLNPKQLQKRPQKCYKKLI